MSIFHASVALLFLGSVAVAQSCEPSWQPGDPLPWATGSIAATTTWDPDGAGPLPLQLVVGGRFTAGALGEVTVAAFDGAQWLPLDGMPGADVTALAVWNGVLVAASGTAGVLGGYVCSWNGTNWLPLGSSQHYGRVEAMTVHGSSLVVGGSFIAIGGTGAASIARYDGTSWSALGSGVSGTVHALASFSGALHVGGIFQTAGGLPVAHHAIWNNAWFVGATFDFGIRAFAVRQSVATTSTYLYAAGQFTTVQNAGLPVISAPCVARLTASTQQWAAVGSGIPAIACIDVFVRSTGLSSFEVTAVATGAAAAVWRFGAAGWAPLGAVTDDYATATPEVLSHFGGYVLGSSGAARALRRFDGMQDWVPVVGPGIDGRVVTSCAAGSDIVIAGTFAAISGVTTNGVARGAPGAWQPLGSGLEGGDGPLALATLANGDIVAAGDFTIAGGVPASRIARWNGSAWAELGGGVDGVVRALGVMPNGDLVVAGDFTVAGGVPCNGIARWSGSSWSPLGSGSSAAIHALHAAPNGELVAGGEFTSIGGVPCNRVARWNGSTWSALGSGLNDTVRAVATAPNGDVVAGGAFTNAGGSSGSYFARWNGAAWSGFGTGLHPLSDVLSLAVLPDGDVVATGATWWFSFPPFSVRAAVVRFDAATQTWASLHAAEGSVHHVRVLPQGGLAIGGSFHHAAQSASGNFAVTNVPCPATATSFGAGCSGDTLTAATLPWVEATFRSVGSGLPSTAIVLTVTSVTPVAQGLAPLSLFFGQALPGCDVLVAPDILGVLVTTTGTVVSDLALPNTPPLVGVTFYHQFVPIAVDTQGVWTAVSSTNALQLTAGVF